MTLKKTFKNSQGHQENHRIKETVRKGLTFNKEISS
jgi:hypothetical protein